LFLRYLWSFCVDTIAKYKYEENYTGCRIKIDRRFNLRSENMILGEIKTANESGTSYTYLSELGKELIYTRYSNNPELLNRMLVLYKLEPYPFLSTSELPTDSAETKDLKTNFNKYVSLLEEEEKLPIEIYYQEKGYKATLEKLASYQDNVSLKEDQTNLTPDSGSDQEPKQ